MAGGAGDVVRPLIPEDLGLQTSEVSRLRGTLTVSGTAAIAQIDMIEGSVARPFTVLGRLTSVTKAYGATTLRIRMTLANERLYNVLAQRYALVTEGGSDYIEIPIPRGIAQ